MKLRSGHSVISTTHKENLLLTDTAALPRTVKLALVRRRVRLKALSVSTSVYQIMYVCRRMNPNHCVNVCHMVTDLKLQSNYSCVCSDWIALSHYIDIKILIRLSCWTVFLSLNKHHMFAWQSQKSSLTGCLLGVTH